MKHIENGLINYVYLLNEEEVVYTNLCLITNLKKPIFFII